MTARITKRRAATSGALQRNPQRFRRRGSPSGLHPIGDPPHRLGTAERAAWIEFANSLPWLNGAHRVLLELTCRLAARMETGEQFGIAAAHCLSALLSKLGATPVDAQRVAWNDDPEDDPADRFFGRPN